MSGCVYRLVVLEQVRFYPCFSVHRKRRFVPPVTSNAKFFVMRQILYEEETMKILSRPYITAVSLSVFHSNVSINLFILYRNKNRRTYNPLEGLILNIMMSLCTRKLSNLSNKIMQLMSYDDWMSVEPSMKSNDSNK